MEARVTTPGISTKALSQYERIAAFFDRFSGEEDGWLAKTGGYHVTLRRTAASLVPPGCRVLEIGCGRGDLLAATRPSEGVGVDVSPGMVEAARRRHPELEFTQAAGEDLELGRKFDYILLCELVPYVYDLQALFEVIARHSHGNTKVIVSTYSNAWRPLLATLARLRLRPRRPVRNWVAPRDLVNLAELGGLEVVQERKEILLPTRSRLLSAWINGLLARLPLFRSLTLTYWLVGRPTAVARTELGVSVVIPCRNEAGSVAEIVKRVPAMGRETELIFVEGGSSDDTRAQIEAAIAAGGRDMKLVVQSGKGKWNAVQEGFAAARHEVLMILDGDMTVAPEDLPHFYDALASGRGELINGSRLVYGMEAGAMRFLNLVGNKVFAAVMSRVLGQYVKDTLCGTKALHRDAWSRIDAVRRQLGPDDPFGDYHLLLGASLLGMKILNVPVRYHARVYGDTSMPRFSYGGTLVRLAAAGVRKIWVAPVAGGDWPPGRRAEPPAGRRPALRELSVAGGLLLALGAAVFGSHVANGGFSEDDWWIAAHTRYPGKPGLGGLLSAFHDVAYRPVEMVYFPLTSKLFGTHTALQLGWTVLMGVLMSFCLYLLLRTLGFARIHSWAIAALVLIFPASDSTRLWAQLGMASLAISLYLVGTLVALEGLRSRGRRSVALHALAVALFLLSVLTYEVAAVAVLFSVLLYAHRAGWSRAWRPWLADLAAVLPALVLVTHNNTNSHVVGLSQYAGHAERIAREAVSLVTYMAAPFADTFGAPLRAAIVLLMVGVLAAAFLAWRRLGAGDPVRAELGRWLGAAAAGAIAIVAAYLIFVPAPAFYLPLAPDGANRYNAFAAVGIVLLLYSVAVTAGILLFRKRPRWQPWAGGFAVAAALFLGVGYVNKIDTHKGEWERGTTAESQVLAALRSGLPSRPGHATVYVFGEDVDAAAGVPVFGASWDLDDAAEVEWHDPALHAYPIRPRASVGCGTRSIHLATPYPAVAEWGGHDVYAHPSAYGRTYFTDMRTGRTVDIRTRSQCRSDSRRFESGRRVLSGT